MFLSSIKQFHDEDEKEGVKTILEKISKLNKINEDEYQRDYQLISNMIICFVDFMRLMAPSVELELDVTKVKIIN